MKYNGPCADTAGSAGEGLWKKGGTSMRKRNKVVSLLMADRKSTRLNSSHKVQSRMPSSA